MSEVFRHGLIPAWIHTMGEGSPLEGAAWRGPEPAFDARWRLCWRRAELALSISPGTAPAPSPEMLFMV